MRFCASLHIPSFSIHLFYWVAWFCRFFCHKFCMWFLVSIDEKFIDDLVKLIRFFLWHILCFCIYVWSKNAIVALVSYYTQITNLFSLRMAIQLHSEIPPGKINWIQYKNGREWRKKNESRFRWVLMMFSHIRPNLKSNHAQPKKSSRDLSIFHRHSWKCLFSVAPIYFFLLFLFFNSFEF